MMSAKMATPGQVKITVFWSKGYDVIIYVGNVTNERLSRDSNCIVDVFMWPKWEIKLQTKNVAGIDQKTIKSLWTCYKSSWICYMNAL